MSAMGIPPEIATSVIASTEPQPSPNPEGLYIRPNMLNQVPDSYYRRLRMLTRLICRMLHLDQVTSEEIDLRGFEKLQGLLDNA